jgi:hypothetical protein
MVAEVEYSMAGRSGGRVTLCAGFLVESQNQGVWFVSVLASNPLGRFDPVWPQNRW